MNIRMETLLIDNCKYRAYTYQNNRNVSRYTPSIYLHYSLYNVHPMKNRVQHIIKKFWIQLCDIPAYTNNLPSQLSQIKAYQFMRIDIASGGYKNITSHEFDRLDYLWRFALIIAWGMYIQCIFDFTSQHSLNITLMPRFASLIGLEEMRLKPKRRKTKHTFVLTFI